MDVIQSVISREDLFELYEKFYTCKLDAREKQKLVSLGRECLGSLKQSCKFIYFPFEEFTKALLSKTSEEDSERKGIDKFKDLQKVFEKLEEYGTRLLKHPWRREFYTIKVKK
jgi:hypothetical protein